MNMIKAGHYIKVNDVMLDTLMSTDYTSYTASVVCYLLNEISIRYHNNCNKDGYMLRDDRTIVITEQEASKMLRYNVCTGGAKYIPGDNMEQLKNEVFAPGQRQESIVTESDLAKVGKELYTNIYSYICATDNKEYLIYLFSTICYTKDKNIIEVIFNADFIEMYFGVLEATGQGQDKYKMLYVDVMVSMNRRRSQRLFGFITKYQLQLDKYGYTNWTGIRELKNILGITNDIRTGELIATTDNALKDINKCMEARIVDGVYHQYNIEYKKLDESKKTSPYSYFRVIQTINEAPTDKVKTKKVTKPKSKQKDNSAVIKEIIDYLNNKMGTKYTYTAKLTVKNINARIKEGYTVQDFKHVIDVKVNDWKGTDMEKYIRPETLFGNKMENYVNEKVQPQSGYNNVKNDYVAGTNSTRISDDWETKSAIKETINEEDIF